MVKKARTYDRPDPNQDQGIESRPTDTDEPRQDTDQTNPQTISRDTQTTQETTINISDNIIKDNDNTNVKRPNNEYTGKTQKEISAQISESPKGDSESIPQNPIDEILKEIGISGIAQRWRDLIPSPPQDYFLTKEDYELVKSYLTMLVANTDRNILEYIRNKSNDPCSLDRLKQFIIVRKIGTIQSQAYQIRIEALKHALSEQVKIIQSYAQTLAACAQSMSNSYILTEALGSIQLPNIVQDLKLVSIISAMLVGLGSTGISIGNIKNQITQLLQINEFCIRGCRACAEPLQLSTLKMNELAKEAQDYNEGIEYAQTIEYTLRTLEKLMAIELDYASYLVEREKTKPKRKPKKPEST